MSSHNLPILVADDDRAMVRTLCDVLRLAGWDTVGVFSGEDAVRKVEEASFAAVLMDVRMAGISGVDALRAIHERRPTLPVILMTAYASTLLLREAEDIGAARVLHKPVSIPGLIELLTTMTAARRALLVVDDDPAFLRSLSSLLEDAGYTVLQAATLEQALTTLERRSAAIVLLDLKLENHEPRDVLDKIRLAGSGVPLIVFSGFPDLLEEIKHLPAGARIVGRLQKPFPPEELTRMLDDLIA